MTAQLPEPPEGHCFHCLQPLPDDGALKVKIAEQEFPVCCYGCQAVAHTIAEHNLLHFYQYRDTSNPLQIPLLPEELTELEAYDDPDLQDEMSYQVEPNSSNTARETTLSVEGITCSACAWLIERELARLNGIEKATVNASTQRLTVRWQPDQVKLSQILQTVAGLGYRALPFQAAQQELDFKQKRRYFTKRIGVAGLATMQVMMLAFGLYFGVYNDIDPEIRGFFWWVSLIFATPVLLYSAQPFYLSALRSIQAQRPNMDVPVSIALLGAYGASAYATIIQQGEVYFESVSMFTFFLLLGRYLELLAKQRAVAAAANLIKLLPALAERELPNGELESVAAHKLQVGDIIQVKAGAKVPADGELLSQVATLDEHILTGESKPLRKTSGQPVYAGSINQHKSLRARVTASTQHTVLASIIRLQDSALASKPKLAQTAENLANKFVSRLLILATLTFIGWSFYDPEQAFWITLSVLVATCPCALALAAPTAVTGAIHKLNKHGILLRNADTLNRIQSIKTVVFDKTGTLTNGTFSLQQTWVDPNAPFAAESLLQLVGKMELTATHPLAQALAPYAKSSASPIPVRNVEEHIGSGMTAEIEVDGTWQAIRLGSLSYICEWHPNFVPASNEFQVFLASQQEVYLALALGDSVRAEMATTVQALKQQNIKLVMLTGDQWAPAQQLADQLQLDQVVAQCSPADKLNYVTKLQQQGAVLMIGDGVNDGPVLAQADIAVTFSEAADLARTAADVVLLQGKGSSLLQFWQIAARARTIMRQNIIWALVYNIIIIPVAVAGFITPYWAALGMSASSLLVLLNSLRLYR